MHISKKKIWSAAAFVLMFTLLLSMTVFAADGEAAQPKMYATFWALIPPVVAIALALITKEVYSSLFVGILVGAMFYSDFSFEGTIVHIFKGGLLLSSLSPGGPLRRVSSFWAASCNASYAAVQLHPRRSKP